MLRTGQSLLATALVYPSLGRSGLDFSSILVPFLASILTGCVPIIPCMPQTMQSKPIVLRFALHVVSLQGAQEGAGWKKSWEGCWAVIWIEHRLRRNQVRRCYHPSRLNVDISSGPWSKNFQKRRLGSRSWLMARSSRKKYTRHHIYSPDLLDPARKQDG